MNGRWLRLGVAAFALSGCVIPRDYDDDDDRPRERARSECTEEAHDQDYRRIEVQTVRQLGRGQWEVTIQAETDPDAILDCAASMTPGPGARA